MKSHGFALLPTLMITAILSLCLYRAYGLLFGSQTLAKTAIEDHKYLFNTIETSVQTLGALGIQNEKLTCNIQNTNSICTIKFPNAHPAIHFGEIFSESDLCLSIIKPTFNELHAFDDIKSASTCIEIDIRKNFFITLSNIQLQNFAAPQVMKFIASAGTTSIEKTFSIKSNLTLFSAGSIKIHSLHVPLGTKIVLSSLRGITIDNISGGGQVLLLPHGDQNLNATHPWLEPLSQSIWAAFKTHD